MRRRVIASAALYLGVVAATASCASGEPPASTTPAAMESPAAVATATPLGSALPVTEPTAGSPSPSPSEVEDAESVSWTMEGLWQECQAAWSEKEPGISWVGWAKFDPTNAVSKSEKHYVVRYELDSDGNVRGDRGCLIQGTPANPDVAVDPALDG